ncbi:hypothetical protein CALVIDRAFT_415830 [Calocera viscosa TUFC12733]|uniref:Uncharacterized protein n=1 Tax=Calocera viscosa (strain TUFC12733) TaxID=1330018 RepID=A0A167G0J0_CALVF|nr:hypothetical protein CALVIDRAFT_415830 [Calocera viscosa TUFC12733]
MIIITNLVRTVGRSPVPQRGCGLSVDRIGWVSQPERCLIVWQRCASFVTSTPGQFNSTLRSDDEHRQGGGVVNGAHKDHSTCSLTFALATALPSHRAFRLPPPARSSSPPAHPPSPRRRAPFRSPRRFRVFRPLRRCRSPHRRCTSARRLPPCQASKARPGLRRWPGRNGGSQTTSPTSSSSPWPGSPVRVALRDPCPNPKTKAKP